MDLHDSWSISGQDRGFSIGLKVPHTLVNSALDLYYQFPCGTSCAQGVGVEAAAMPGLYYSFSHYFDEAYVTFTGRASLYDKSVRLNSQLALGTVRHPDLFLFLGYELLLGGASVQTDGFDFDDQIAPTTTIAITGW